MNKIVSLFLLSCFCLLTISCQFSEELTLNEDGSGKMSIKFDGSEIMKMGGEKVSENKEEDVDTLIVFKEFLEEHKDSISKLPLEEQERLKKLENFKMHMVINAEEQVMNMDMYTDFKDVSELGDIFNNFKTASAVGKNGNATSQSGMMDPLAGKTEDEDATKVSYSFKGNKFIRSTEILDREKLKKELDSLESMKMFLASSKYKLNYSFPRKIKKISNKNALFGQDGKSFVLEIDFIKYMEDPKLLDVVVELEK